MANEKLKMNEVRPGEDLLASELEAIAGGTGGEMDAVVCDVGCAEGTIES